MPKEGLKNSPNISSAGKAERLRQELIENKRQEFLGTYHIGQEVHHKIEPITGTIAGGAAFRFQGSTEVIVNNIAHGDKPLTDGAWSSGMWSIFDIL